MRLGVSGLGVVQVVGRHQRQREVVGQSDEVAGHPGLDVEPVVHELDVEVVGAEDVAQVAGRLAGLVVAADPQPGLHLAGRAAGEGDDALGVLGEDLVVHPRLVEEALDAGPRRQPEQVVHAGGVLGEQRQVGERTTTGHVVVPALVPLHARAVEPAGARREIGLDADDRLDAASRGLLVEVVGTEHVAVVGDRQSRHLLRDRLVKQLADPRGAVQHRVLGVVVQVHELRPGHSPTTSSTPTCVAPRQHPRHRRRRPSGSVLGKRLEG